MNAAGLISVEEALRSVLLSVERPLEEEFAPLAEAIGRTLARDVKALRTQPPFACSAMDGYAVKAADARAGAHLRVVGEAAAGRAFSGRLETGEAVRIFTGAPIPEGADAVLLQEDVRREDATIAVGSDAAQDENIRTVGLDFSETLPLLPAGRRLTPRDIALAAAANHAGLTVRRRPRVAILANGDELVSPGATIGPAQIVASNNFAVAGVAEAAGAEVADLGIAPDDRAKLAAAIDGARRKEADVLVTIGGASVGDYDLVQEALKSLGMALGFWRIAMRPGKPLMHGKLKTLNVLGLPGNPASAFVCAVIFLRPLLRALQGDPSAGEDFSEPAILGADMPANGPRKDFVRATLTRGPNGTLLTAPAGLQDSSLVSVLARAEALLVREPRAPPAKRGEPCRVIRLSTLGV